ncbi:MAG: hypothetical protein FWH26_09300 [Oscillospiraceae bacterium]|nr:hypothetical protein [Oscillospiraceae bacterium]
MKLTKRILCIVLAATLLCGVGTVAMASETENAQEDRTNYPTIYLAGGWHALYTDYGTKEKRKAYFDTSDSMTTDKETRDAIFEAIGNLDFDALGKGLSRMFTKAYEDVAMDCDGESINPDLECPVRIYFDPGTLDYLATLPTVVLEDVLGLDPTLLKQFPDGTRYYGADVGVYFKDNEGYFSFDWRLDPRENAALLHTWIETTFIDEDVSDKVNLAFVSGSGPIGLSYLYEYGTEYLNAITFNESFHNGSSLWGGIATRQFALGADALGNTGPMYCWSMQDTIKPLITPIRVLYEVGLIDVAAKVLNFAASDAFNKLYEEALIPMWFHMPFYWALVPHSIYEQAKRALFPDHSSYAQHANLFEKTDFYHNYIMADSDNILAEAAEEIKVGINCGYGFPLSPYSATSYVSSDELLDTQYASSGATCAPPNRPFSVFYKQVNPGDVNYVSPDRYIDASTCVLPDYTWFNKDMPHLPDLRLDGWVEWFANAPKGKDSVHDNDDYPQWMKFVAYGVFEPLDHTDTVWNKISDTLLAAAMWILGIWRKILLLPLFWMG